MTTESPVIDIYPSVVAPRERAIHIEGGLFGPDLLEKLQSGDLPGQRPEDFGKKAGRSILDEVAEIYRDAKELWQIFQRRLERKSERDSITSITREVWIIPFLSLLDYELQYNFKSYSVGETSYQISHRAGDNEDAPPVHIVGVDRELGHADPTGRPRISPHALLQEFLNRTEHLWGIVTNGRRLRLLRDSTYVRKQAYVEFDLEAIFEAEGDAYFNDFVLLYRLLHRTRLPNGTADAHNCLLEKYYQEALEQGNRARDRLRDGVEECLKIMGTGFIRANDSLPYHEDIARRLYADLLHLVYRFLFLLVAEDRGLLTGNDLYREYYSISRLRRLVDRQEAYTDHYDLWHSLRALWYLLRDDVPVAQIGSKPLASLLDLQVLNGNLFDKIGLDDLVISNRDLLKAFYNLVYYYDEEARAWRRVNYAALDVEELGSVYESLLDHHPEIKNEPGGPVFTFAPGMERKSTGSYYTPPELVQELIKSALEPVLEEKLQGLNDKVSRKQAILSIRVLDPACGSGHFLLAAARRLAKELARVETGEEEPSPEAEREARREVITHCIYGVDKNPLAIELCKVALWIESNVPGKPLTFLDHRIRCGDSLVGVFDLTVLEKGIPDEAFIPVSGDDKNAMNLLKKQNRNERKDIESGNAPLAFPADEMFTNLVDQYRTIAGLSDNSPAEVRRKKELYEKYNEDQSRQKLINACNLWTGAFFQSIQEKRKEHGEYITTHVLWDHLNGNSHIQTIAQAEVLAQRYSFFHWPLEFPEVFADGGFNVVLGNPPWERIKLQEQEFFKAHDLAIANAPNAAARKRLIAALKEKKPNLWAEYMKALYAAESTSRFLRGSGQYPLTARGDINTYSVFAERIRSLLRPGGRAGIIVPTGIATDDTNKSFFADLIERGELLSLFDFENRRKLFPAIDSRMKFSLLTMFKSKDRVQMVARPSPPIVFAFFCHSARDLSDPERRFTLRAEDFRLFNPNTLTSPIFRCRQDAELTKYIYRRIPVLVKKTDNEIINPWEIEFLDMFHMANDSDLFRTYKELQEDRFQLGGNVFVRGKEHYLPLYEAKMFHQYNHRFGDFAMQPLDSKSTQLPEVPLERLADPDYQVFPRYWVPEAEVEGRLRTKGWDRGWLLGWRKITNATNERTLITAVIPRVGVGNSSLLILPKQPKQALLLLATLNTLACDFCARQKLGGTNLSFYILEQLPVIPPQVYDRSCPWLPGQTIYDFIRPRVLELTYTAWDLNPFARDLGYDGPPFGYDPDRRAQLRAELDALFFLLYLGTPEEWEREASPELKALFPTPLEAISYILDQFPILLSKEEELFGEYRTRNLILTIYKSLINSG